MAWPSFHLSIGKAFCSSVPFPAHTFHYRQQHGMVCVDGRIGEEMKNFSPTGHSQNTCLSHTAQWLSISSLPITLSQEESGLQGSSCGPVRPESGRIRNACWIGNLDKSLKYPEPPSPSSIKPKAWASHFML